MFPIPYVLRKCLDYRHKDTSPASKLVGEGLFRAPEHQEHQGTRAPGQWHRWIWDVICYAMLSYHAHCLPRVEYPGNLMGPWLKRQIRQFASRGRKSGRSLGYLTQYEFRYGVWSTTARYVHADTCTYIQHTYSIPQHRYNVHEKVALGLPKVRRECTVQVQTSPENRYTYISLVPLFSINFCLKISNVIADLRTTPAAPTSRRRGREKLNGQWSHRQSRMVNEEETLDRRISANLILLSFAAQLTKPRTFSSITS